MILAGNKKAYFDYFVEEKFEAGIELQGSEVKSAKAGKVSIKESFVRIINGELFIMGMSIVPWSYGSIYNPEEKRVRRLLLHKKEIRRLHEKVSQKGYTIVPLDVHLSHGYVKVEIALARGKKTYDKRESIAKRDVERDIRRSLKENNR
ncbi:SsrA-binding protein [Fusobacterium necrophorum subsp. funduliforme]|uniref:SsrA-binding protein n=4 Tax=Fusobacterium necrophorum TaxID=859 RepID=A0AAN3VW47_9FUSO|nr:SsrA-binding protein SmpB [Fusobacterium necrophorum]AVQ20314.1 SsrA-binding protein SmpB [Fusobacterium necrophorum subsp. funduliforme]AYV93909.1 SsrA-binding protein SmpB [Fusobacterium necrophorum subsp. funduliforme]AYV96077.1 SsrA-binding protein SmpB [Fusobacterium necrophorum subsp. funduliforme]EFS24049.1 SsrA-binding protein [Fusobacterium necrophorum D12]EIJ71675.1 SsrA-binding protein [Fusobacterium necrophorum subsp. funduliforme ATCC 51357]